MTFRRFDGRMIAFLNRWSIPALRWTLAIVFLWFGALKLAGESPVAGLIETSWWFLPAHQFLVILGIWEVLIGLGLAFRKALRTTLALLWLQMAGTLLSLVLTPDLFFRGNFLLLTTEGEFVVKNLVLISASLVVGAHYVRNGK